MINTKWKDNTKHSLILKTQNLIKHVTILKTRSNGIRLKIKYETLNQLIRNTTYTTPNKTQPKISTTQLDTKWQMKTKTIITRHI